MDRPLEELHTPVMLEECLDAMRPALAAPDALYVDATTGMGGHLSAVLREFPHVRAVAIDRDPQALEIARTRVGADAATCRFVHATYDEIPRVLDEVGYVGADAILMDLGVSSLQLDMRSRGFSYARDAHLDMRMDSSGGRTAADILATASQAELTRILRTYGEERFAPKIAAGIVAARDEAPVETSAQLVQIIRSSLPQAAMRHGGNPAKRTFQALRIAVNDELDILEAALPRAIAALNPQGRLVVESYHSLEDRLVKRAMRDATTTQLPPGVPVREVDRDVGYRLVFSGAKKASAQEISTNSRSASVRLRALTRTTSS